MKNYRRYLVLAILGALIIGLAFYLFLNNYLDSKNILVFSKDIKAGEIIEEGDLCFKPYYKKALPKNYLVKKEAIVGKVTHMDRKQDDYASKDILEEQDDSNILNTLEENQVLMAINLSSSEPILNELKIGQKISIVSSKKDNYDYHNFNIIETVEEEFSIYKNNYVEQNTFSLAKNILLIDSQIIIRNLKILDIEIVEASQNVLINSNKKDTNIYICCQMQEAPYLANIIKSGDFKVIIEKE